MTDEQPGEVLFRASKRRKVVRKRPHQDGPDDEPSPLALAHESGTAITKHHQENDENGVDGMTRVQKKGPVKKFGIGFSSADSSRYTGQEQLEEQALIAVSEDGVSEIPKNDRFVRPTGRVGVTEDKHMMAYVDSKLAETRPVADVPTKSTKNNLGIDSSRTDGDAGMHGRTLDVRSSGDTPHPKSGDRTFQQAQERSRRVYQRPTKRRPPPSREQIDVARDSMIDQIMGENQVPHYDRSVPQTHHEEGDDMDNDAAAAEEFKAQLLADLERNKRRPPLSKSTATTSSGPKLGGSRSQREKMRALEEAKTSASKK